MRRFVVTVNGKRYDVGVEEVDAASAPAVPAPVSTVKESAPAPAETAEEPKAAPVDTEIPEGGEKVEAPMPGTILEVTVQKGDKVNKGDPIMVLEAMKLENDILAPASGTVVSINVSKGTVVNVGDVLAVIG
ncbi:MAG: biotin/lipoyl-binding protein [Clostridia bacterium]|nr:biotin/lipoyl-binding protein [Clostridia bacterium]MBR0438359.1 biotin/lipoyl-binding protein [Clostridia bacterium]MBR3564193.1 biotin/lipoyl-binding protein [Clostridia bacterium]